MAEVHVSQFISPGWADASTPHNKVTDSETCAGAKLDVWLAQRHGYEDVHVSRSLVLQRYHGNVSVLDTLVYRLRLLRVRATVETMFLLSCCSACASAPVRLNSVQLTS